ncbi:MAG: hypothetical protein AB8G23_05740 [Myxococcota bacterium]
MTTTRQTNLPITPNRQGLARPSRFGAALLALGLFCACASVPPAPDWVKDNPDRFPSERFFRGIASDRSEEIASERALDLVSEATMNEPGAAIAETWFDEERERHWAIAVLEKKPILDRLASERQQIEDEISQAFQLIESDRPDQVLSRVARAASLIPERNQLIERLDFLGSPSEFSKSELEAQNRRVTESLSSLKKELRIEISAFEIDARSGETRTELERNRRALYQEAVAHGFTPGSSDEGWGMDPVWLSVRSTVSVERLELRPNDTLISVQWDAAVEITDMAAGANIVGVLTETGRAVHSTDAEARRQAEAAARDFSASAFGEWLSARTTKGN